MIGTGGISAFSNQKTSARNKNQHDFRHSYYQNNQDLNSRLPKFGGIPTLSS